MFTGKFKFKQPAHKPSTMASQNGAGTAASSLPPEAIAFAGRMFDAARSGNKEIFEQALPAGLPANMTNEKGDTLVR